MEHWMRTSFHFKPESKNSDVCAEYQKYLPHRLAATTFLPLREAANSFAVVSLNTMGSSNLD